MLRGINIKTVSLLLVICFFVVCFTCGCIKIVPDPNTEPSRPTSGAPADVTDPPQGEGTQSGDATTSKDPTDNAGPTENPDPTDTTEVTEPDPTDAPGTEEPSAPTEPEQTEGVQSSEATTPPEEQEQVYTITYENLSGATHNNPASYTKDTAASIVLTPPTERPGYTFEGWYIGDTKVDSLAGFSSDVILTAKWKENSNDGAIELPEVDF